MSLRKNLNGLADEQKGGAMLYELIELAKESLTSNNLPSVVCVICLYELEEEDDFIKTECYHYFHSHCLANYIEHAVKEEEKVVCLVCRELLSYDLKQLRKASTPRQLLENGDYVASDEMKAQQRERAALYKKQQERGAIIDVEAEKNKFLIDISTTPDITVVPTIPKTRPDETDVQSVSGNANTAEKETQKRDVNENVRDKDSASRSDRGFTKDVKNEGSRQRQPYNKGGRYDRDRPRSGKYESERSGQRSRGGSARDERYRNEGHHRRRDDAGKKPQRKEPDTLEEQKSDSKKSEIAQPCRKLQSEEGHGEEVTNKDDTQTVKSSEVTQKENADTHSSDAQGSIKQVPGNKEKATIESRNKPSSGRRYHQSSRGRGGRRFDDGQYREDKGYYRDRKKREYKNDGQDEIKNGNDDEITSKKGELTSKRGHERKHPGRKDGKDRFKSDSSGDLMLQDNEGAGRPQSGKDNRNRRSQRPPPGFQTRKPQARQQNQSTEMESRNNEGDSVELQRKTGNEKANISVSNNKTEESTVKIETMAENKICKPPPGFEAEASHHDKRGKPPRKPPGFEGKDLDNKSKTKPVNPPPGFDDFR
ncbi:E3 ubiquitin-protein ligase RNF25-like isoform X2 [Ptychodera flava]